MQSIGKSVYELKTDDDAAWYRLMYLARIDDVIYVLDCFKKDTAKTEKKDLARSEARYKQVQRRLREVTRDAKSKQRSEPANARNKG